MSNTKIYYFAYGSNMSLKQMVSRCPHTKFVAIAKINNFEFELSGYSRRWKSGVATIRRKKGSEVWGVVYKIDDDCLKKLDGFESIKYKLYERIKVTCHYANGRTVMANVYVQEPKKLTHWGKRYRRVILSGAKNFNLPESYIRMLAKNQT